MAEIETVADRVRKADEVLRIVREDIVNVSIMLPPFNSTHEGYALVKEEFDKLWLDIMAGNGCAEVAIERAMQVASAAVRYAADLRNWSGYMKPDEDDAEPGYQDAPDPVTAGAIVAAEDDLGTRDLDDGC